MEQAPKKTRGRPRKAPDQGTEKQVKKREYMRKYVGEIKQGITQLELDEAACLKKLEEIRKERSKLIDMIENANKQAADILKSNLKSPIKASKPAPVAMPKPLPKKIIKNDDVFFEYLKNEGAQTVQGAIRRKLATKK
jgi:hypothetical protein